LNEVVIFRCRVLRASSLGPKTAMWIGHFTFPLLQVKVENLIPDYDDRNPFQNPTQ
jgi:hypothetical protein